MRNRDRLQQTDRQSTLNTTKSILYSITRIIIIMSTTMLPQKVIAQTELLGDDSAAAPAAQPKQQQQQQKGVAWTPNEFIERLYFVNLTNDDEDDDNDTDKNAADKKIPWPCIRFDNMEQCHTVLQQRGILTPADQKRLIQAVLDGENPNNPFLFLFGQRTPRNERVIELKEQQQYEKNDQEDDVFVVELLDFKDNFIEFYMRMLGKNQDFVEASKYLKSFFNEAVQEDEKRVKQQKRQQQQQQQQGRPTKTPAPRTTTTTTAAAAAAAAKRTTVNASSSSAATPVAVSPAGSSFSVNPPLPLPNTKQPAPKARTNLIHSQQPTDKTQQQQQNVATRKEHGSTPKDPSQAVQEEEQQQDAETEDSSGNTPTVSNAPEEPRDVDATKDTNMTEDTPQDATPAQEQQDVEMEHSNATDDTHASEAVEEPRDIEMEEAGRNQDDSSSKGVSQLAQEHDVNMNEAKDDACQETRQEDAEMEDSNKAAEQQQESEFQSNDNEDIMAMIDDSARQAESQPTTTFETNDDSTTLPSSDPQASGDTSAQACVTTPKVKRDATKKPPQSTSSSKSSASSLASSKKPPKKIDEEQLIKFNDIKGPLTRAGFIFRKNLYCHPGMDPIKNSVAVEGRDYFTNEESFRRDLCAYGLDESDKWTEDEREKIETWVRYTIFGFPDSESIMPIYKEVSPSQVWKLFEKIGFKHDWKHTELWSFPTFNDGRDGVLGMTSFSNEYDLWTRIARFGFPENSKFDNITDVDRMRLVYSLIWNRVHKEAVNTL